MPKANYKLLAKIASMLAVLGGVFSFFINDETSGLFLVSMGIVIKQLETDL